MTDFDRHFLRRAAENLRSPYLCNWDARVAAALADWLDAADGSDPRAVATARALLDSFGIWPRADVGAIEDAASDAEASDAPWTHGTRLGREHRSVRQHLVEDHGVSQGQVDAWSDGAVHGHHDGVHRTTWAYANDLAHPAPGDREYQANAA